MWFGVVLMCLCFGVFVFFGVMLCGVVGVSVFVGFECFGDFLVVSGDFFALQTSIVFFACLFLVTS